MWYLIVSIPDLCNLTYFNAILNSGQFPSIWTEGIISPLFKKHDPRDVNNYRGDHFIKLFLKIFTGVLNKRLTDWPESYNVSSDSQFGFRRGRSTREAISVIQKFLNEKKRLYCAFADFR